MVRPHQVMSVIIYINKHLTLKIKKKILHLSLKVSEGLYLTANVFSNLISEMTYHRLKHNLLVIQSNPSSMWMALHKGMKTRKQRPSEAILETCCHDYLRAAENFIKLFSYFLAFKDQVCVTLLWVGHQQMMTYPEITTY